MDHAAPRIEDALARIADVSPQRTVLVDRDRQVTAAELAERAAALAAGLRARGVERGDRVALLLEKSLEAVVALYGAWMAGAAAVPIHESLKRPQIAHILEQSGTRCLVTDERRLARASATDLAIARLDVPDARAPRVEPAERTPADELAAILYTSGSTGRPKGIALSHENLVAGTRIVAGYLGLRESERILSVLPFSFDYGLNQLLTAIDRGATLVLQRSHMPADVVRALERFEITGLAGVPPLWAQLAQRGSGLDRARLPCLRYVTNSGGVFPEALLARYRALLPRTRVFLMYGLTEAFRSTYLPPDEIDRRPGSMGRAIPETEILVVDEHGRRCAPGEVGELVHAGPTVALGYWRDEAATRERFRPHPFDPDHPRPVVYSGDLVRADEDGYLYFVGRRDQMLKCSGFRVSPDEAEEHVFATGLVAEVAIVGRPDEIAGTVLVAHVVPRDPAGLDVAELIDRCRARMPSYMVPADIRVHERLPRTSSGKLDRKGLA